MPIRKFILSCFLPYCEYKKINHEGQEIYINELYSNSTDSNYLKNADKSRATFYGISLDRENNIIFFGHVEIYKSWTPYSARPGTDNTDLYTCIYPYQLKLSKEELKIKKAKISEQKRKIKQLKDSELDYAIKQPSTWAELVEYEAEAIDHLMKNSVKAINHTFFSYCFGSSIAIAACKKWIEENKPAKLPNLIIGCPMRNSAVVFAGYLSRKYLIFLLSILLGSSIYLTVFFSYSINKIIFLSFSIILLSAILYIIYNKFTFSSVDINIAREYYENRNEKKPHPQQYVHTDKITGIVSKLLEIVIRKILSKYGWYFDTQKDYDDLIKIYKEQQQIDKISYIETWHDKVYAPEAKLRLDQDNLNLLRYDPDGKEVANNYILQSYHIYQYAEKTKPDKWWERIVRVIQIFIPFMPNFYTCKDKKAYKSGDYEKYIKKYCINLNDNLILNKQSEAVSKESASSYKESASSYTDSENPNLEVEDAIAQTNGKELKL